MTKKRKCKYCKNSFEPIAFLQKNCFDPECVTEWIQETKEKNWKRKKAKLKADLMTLSDYFKLAQIVFNKYIRLRDKNKPCISCGAKEGTYTLTAGHYFPSTNKSVTFNEDNLHGQCWFNCNSSKYCCASATITVSCGKRSLYKRAASGSNSTEVT